jgi:hypothetical protein
MKKDQLRYEARKAHIYKAMYRPSSNLFHLLGSLLSVLLQGQPRIGNSEVYGRRR